jgi:hypothetical protein
MIGPMSCASISRRAWGPARSARRRWVSCRCCMSCSQWPVVLKELMQITCSECGQPFDDNECCYTCVSRDEAIEVTFRIAFPVAILGLVFGIMFADEMYPPLLDDLGIFMVPGFTLVVALALAFFLQDRLTRYWIFTISLILFVTVTFLIPPAYDFLNGFLDRNPATEITTQVLSKGINSLRSHGQFLVLSLPLNHSRANVEVIVSTQTFNGVTLHDSVHMVVHPGAFSLAWHDDGCPCLVQQDP